MKVELVSLTQPSKQIVARAGVEQMTAEELIIFEARVSNPVNQQNLHTSAKLLAYCLRKGHVSIFDQVDMTVEIVTSRAISAQIFRHWSMRGQEFSQRYSEATEIEPIELRLQDAKNRQASGEVVLDSALTDLVNDAVKCSVATYEALVCAGVSKETARMILPMAAQTTIYIKGSVRSWIFYLLQRCYSGAQKEHRQVAEAIRPIFAECFPVIYQTLSDPAVVEEILNEQRTHYRQAFV